MRTIFKYPLAESSGTFSLQIPAGGSILTAQVHAGKGTLWVMVDSDAQRVTRKFRVCYTDNYCPAGHKSEYIATYQLPTGLVCHLFEVLALDF